MRSFPTVPRFVEDELGGGGVQVGVGVGSLAVTAALLRPWTGRIGDTRGRRVLAVSGATIVGVSILLYGAASELWMLVLARLLTGAGEAAMFVGVATAAQDLAPDHRRGEAASYRSDREEQCLLVHHHRRVPVAQLLAPTAGYKGMGTVLAKCFFRHLRACRFHGLRRAAAQARSK